jgi:hypothetical protein
VLKRHCERAVQSFYSLMNIIYLQQHEKETYRIAENFRGRKLSRIGENEDLAKKTLTERSSQHCLGVFIDIAYADVCRADREIEKRV